MFLYQITDENLNPLRVAKSPRGLVAYNGIRIDNATSMSVDELADLYIFVIQDHGRPDTSWQSITGNTVVIEGEANAPRDVVCTLEYQVEDISLEAAKEKLSLKLKNYALVVKDGGYNWARTPEETFIVDSDLESRVNLVGIDNMAKSGDLGAGIKFTMADDSEPELTPVELMDLTKSVGVFVVTVHGIKKATLRAINALADLDACKAFDVKAGFPDIPIIDQEIVP